MNEYMPELKRATALPKPFPTQDRSLNEGAGSLDTTWAIAADEFYTIFFAGRPDLEYLTQSGAPMKLVTHPIATNTAEEKAGLIGGDPSDVIKALYFVHKDTGDVYAFVVPSVGRVDLEDSSLMEIMGFNPAKKLRFVAQEDLPPGMDYGTCHPFISNGYSDVTMVFFDQAVVADSRATGRFVDFAITLETQVDNHQLSLQMPYAAAHDVLAQAFPNRVQAVPLNYN